VNKINKVSLNDSNLHQAIDLLQVIVLNLESLRQKPEIAGTQNEIVLDAATREAFDCADLLHEVRNENRDHTIVDPEQASNN
jgi:hypothetical protein